MDSSDSLSAIPDLPVTSAFALDLSYSVFQPTNSLSCIICRFWFVSLTSMMLIACHPSLSLRSRDRIIQNKQTGEQNTQSLQTLRCLHFVTGFSLSSFDCS